MWSDELETQWRQLAEEVLVGMKEWRLQHPRATLPYRPPLRPAPIAHDRKRAPDR